MMDWLVVVFFLWIMLLLLSGYPVALVLGGGSLLFALALSAFDLFALQDLSALPNRIFGIMNNGLLIAVPLFVLMGVTLERGRIAEHLLTNLATLFGQKPGGLAFTVVLVGVLLAASTGIVGATVITMGLLALPAMLKNGYAPALSCGTICAAGTLGQIIPPSIILVILGEVLSNAYQEAQLAQGNFAPKTISVNDLFAGALLPGLLLVALYLLYLFLRSRFTPRDLPTADLGTNAHWSGVLLAILPPLLLIFLVLGAILTGIATATEASGLGAAGALLLMTLYGRMTFANLYFILRDTLKISSMIFLIFIGASIFSLVFRDIGGDNVVRAWFEALPGGEWAALLLIMLLLFLLGFFLDFIEITLIAVPIVAPILFMLGVDPIWFGILVALNLQTSFLTPPFGFALFYLRGVMPKHLSTLTLYQGVWPFILLQLLALGLVMAFPALATGLPKLLYSQ
jgi:tripartite ATP-independent transporter DctM subunit